MMYYTTNYFNTFIEVAEDYPAKTAVGPTARKNGAKTIAMYQYEMIRQHPYQFTSDDVLFEVHTIRKEIPESQKEEERHRFFSKGQPCMRSSPLGKRFGWGIHSNESGKIAIFPVESEEYQRLAEDAGIKHIRAMRSKRG